MSRLQIIEKNIFGTLGQVSHSKKRKKVGKNSQFKKIDTVTRLFYVQCHIGRVRCHVWKLLKKIFFGHWDKCPIRKNWQKKLGKIPNSKILTLWHDYFMPGVTMEGSGVTPDNNLKKDFLGHCDQCPNRKINKKKYWGNHYLLEIF